MGEIFKTGRKLPHKKNGVLVKNLEKNKDSVLLVWHEIVSPLKVNNAK